MPDRHLVASFAAANTAKAQARQYFTDALARDGWHAYKGRPAAPQKSAPPPPAKKAPEPAPGSPKPAEPKPAEQKPEKSD